MLTRNGFALGIKGRAGLNNFLEEKENNESQTMLSVEEREAIDYLKSRLYENECRKFIDVPQNDLRIFLNLVERLQKNFTLKNNKICNLEFIIEKQIEEMKRHIDLDNECEIAYISKIKNLEKEIEELKDKNKKLVV